MIKFKYTSCFLNNSEITIFLMDYNIFQEIDVAFCPGLKK